MPMSKTDAKQLTDRQIRQISEKVYRLMLADIRMNRERLGRVWKKRRLRKKL